MFSRGGLRSTKKLVIKIATAKAAKNGNALRSIPLPHIDLMIINNSWYYSLRLISTIGFAKLREPLNLSYTFRNDRQSVLSRW